MFETKVSGNTFTIIANKLNKSITAKAMASVAREAIISDTLSHNWKRFQSTIKQKSVDKDTEIVYITETKNARKIAGYLNFGTRSHGPVTAKALHWISGGKHIFAKWVRGIQPFGFWGLNSNTLSKIHQFLEQKKKEAFK